MMGLTLDDLERLMVKVIGMWGYTLVLITGVLVSFLFTQSSKEQHKNVLHQNGIFTKLSFHFQEYESSIINFIYTKIRRRTITCALYIKVYDNYRISFMHIITSKDDQQLHVGQQCCTFQRQTNPCLYQADTAALCINDTVSVLQQMWPSGRTSNRYKNDVDTAWTKHSAIHGM